jgi:hypothetical protein
MFGEAWIHHQNLNKKMITRDPITHIDMDALVSGTRLNWLRAAVLGANDGIVSVSSVIFGVAGASNTKIFILRDTGFQQQLKSLRTE